MSEVGLDWNRPKIPSQQSNLIKLNLPMANFTTQRYCFRQMLLNSGRQKLKLC